MYYVATSTGLYATATLAGDNTVWERQGATTIGTTVTPVVETRASDGLVVAGTHGNGVFSTRVTHAWQITGFEDVAQAPSFAASLFPNPSRTPASLQLTTQRAHAGSVLVVDAQGRTRHRQELRVTEGSSTHSLPAHLPAGVYTVQVTLSGGGARTLRWIKAE